MLFTRMRTLGLASAVALLLVGPASAGEGWRVVDTVGTVRTGGAGIMPVALTRDQSLPADAWVQTADGARAVLARGQETIVVEPNSRVQLPDEEFNGNTQVLQTMGSAFYKIGKQKKPHFQVDTPYLAAVVKGTQFTVSVTDGEASVSVTEGLVEVATPDGKDAEFVPPGFTAVVGVGNKDDVVVRQTPKSETAPGAPAGEQAGPKGDDTAEQDKPKSEQIGEVKPVLIPVTVGEIDVNVKEVSGGLAFGEVKTASVDTPGGPQRGAKDSTDDSSGGGKQDNIDGSEKETPKDGGSLTPSLVPGGGGSVSDAGPGKEEGGNGNGHSGGLGGGNGGGLGGGSVDTDLTPALDTGPTVDLGTDNSVGNGGGNGNGNGNGNAGGNGNGNAGGNGNGNGRGRPVI